MITQKEMLSYLEECGENGAFLAGMLRDFGKPFKTFVCYHAVKDFGANSIVIYLDSQVEIYAKLMSEMYRSDPVKYVRYRPVIKRALEMEFGL